MLFKYRKKKQNTTILYSKHKKRINYEAKVKKENKKNYNQNQANKSMQLKSTIIAIVII